MITRSLAIAPRSLNREAMTVDAVISTGAPVNRGAYVEVLDVAGIDASRPHIPLLDSHQQASLANVLGRAVNFRLEGGALVATLKFADTPQGRAAFAGVASGDYASVSIGYQPGKVSDRVTPDGVTVRTVLTCHLTEVSFVPVAADPGAQIRSAPHMDPETKEPANAPAEKQKPITAKATGKTPDGKSSITLETTATFGDAADAGTDAGETETRSATTMTRAAPVNEVRALAQTFGLGDAFTLRHMAAGSSLQTVQADAMSAVQQRAAQAPFATVLAVHDASPQDVIALQGEALFCRAHPTVKPSEQARAYMTMTTLDMARGSLQRAGVSMASMSAADTITRALHSTSDFPAIFADTANRAMRAGYQAAPAAIKAAAKPSTVKDFRAKTSVQLGEAPTLEKVNEHGEFKSGSLAEGKESYAADTFGRIFGVTRKAIINDDVGALTTMATKLGMASAEFEGQHLVSLLEGGAGVGPAMDDGKALFHADHGNLAASAGALAEATLSAARLAMRKQKGLAGRPINVPPKFLIVPPELETTAEKLLAAIQPTKSDDVNPFGGKLELLVEARLSSATRWYVVADPAFIDGLEYAYLQGSEGPQIESRAGWEVDGMEFKIRLDFGAGFLDWRSWYANAGA